MKQSCPLKCLLAAAGAAAGIAGVVTYMVAPARPTKAQKAAFWGANIAHRGLHRPDRSVPENSIPAFAAAVEAGYGVEFDVHLTADGELVVFHDDDLRRMCGVDGAVEDHTYAELREYHLAATQEKIPLLRDVLTTIGGRTPILLELKSGHDNRRLCELTCAELSIYHGAVCVESFDPRILRWWRRNAPQMMRGQLSSSLRSYKGEGKRLLAFAMSNLLYNFLGRPHFIAYGVYGKKPLTVRLCEKMGAMRFAWTCHGPAYEKDNDAVIFEYYRPRTKFKSLDEER